MGASSWSVFQIIFGKAADLAVRRKFMWDEAEFVFSILNNREVGKYTEMFRDECSQSQSGTNLDNCDGNPMAAFFSGGLR